MTEPPVIARVAGAGQPLHRALGLTDDELDRIHEALDRDPSRAELAMYAAMCLSRGTGESMSPR